MPPRRGPSTQASPSTSPVRAKLAAGTDATPQGTCGLLPGKGGPSSYFPHYRTLLRSPVPKMAAALTPQHCQGPSQTQSLSLRKVTGASHLFLYFTLQFPLKIPAANPALGKAVPMHVRPHGLTPCLVQLQRQPRLGLIFLVQAFQQLLVLSDNLRCLLILTAELFLKTTMNLPGFLQLSEHVGNWNGMPKTTNAYVNNHRIVLVYDSGEIINGP